ncbi:hypothetical protein [Arsukibacterium sp.]|uniref:hypothetical protein n=1 Tax=Arsukibacterium sp. TaxID=1977258 RepID=UPI001BD526EE|nr:hypothetical protein [Arsukibacterium sp.]
MPKLFLFQHMLNSLTYSLITLFGFWPWPNAEYSLNGRELTYKEFWLTGMAPGFLAFCILVVAICFATVNRHGFGHYGAFIYWAAIIALMSFYSLTGVLVGSLFIAAWAYYVFGSKKMRRFFAQRTA